MSCLENSEGSTPCLLQPPTPSASPKDSLAKKKESSLFPEADFAEETTHLIREGLLFCDLIDFLVLESFLYVRSLGS